MESQKAQAFQKVMNRFKQKMGKDRLKSPIQTKAPKKNIIGSLGKLSVSPPIINIQATNSYSSVGPNYKTQGFCQTMQEEATSHNSKDTHSPRYNDSRNVDSTLLPDK